MAGLRSVELVGGDVRIAGILELEPTADGIVLHRMPAWARRQHNDPSLAVLETMPSGARIECVTDATCIELDVQLTLVQLGTEPGPMAVFELEVDGHVTASDETRTGALVVTGLPDGELEFRPGGSHTVRFDGLPAGEKRIAIWLPQAAAVTLIELRANGSVRAPEITRRRWAHYGSSISHCLQAEKPTGVWPAVAARLADVDLLSFGFAGQCQLDPFVGRMIAAQPVDLVSLKLGVNVVNADTMRERTFMPAVHGLLDSIRGAHPEIPILLVTPIICPVVEEHPGPTIFADGGQVGVRERSPELSVGALSLRRVRELEAEIVAVRRSAGDDNLHLLSGLDLFGAGDLADLPDGLHPNAQGYQRMGERFHALAFAQGPFGSVEERAVNELP